MKEINKEKWQLDQENEVTAAECIFMLNSSRSRAKEKNHEIHESPRESTHSFAKAIVVARAYRQGTSSCSWAFTYSTYSFNAEVRSVNRKGKRANDYKHSRTSELLLYQRLAGLST